MEWDEFLNLKKTAESPASWLPMRLHEKYDFHKKRTIHQVFLSLGYRKLKRAKARRVRFDKLGLAREHLL
jgi:hypothetical protein